MGILVHRFWLLLLLLVPTLGQTQTIDDRYYMHNQFSPQYVILSDSLGPIHHIKVQRNNEELSTTLRAGDISERENKSTSELASTSVEIFNIFVPFTHIQHSFSYSINDTISFIKGDTLLITMSLLPCKIGNISWKEINPDTISIGHLHSISNLAKHAIIRINKYREMSSPGSHTLLCQDDWKPIIYRQGKYWTPSSYVLTAYFQIRSSSTKVFSVTDMATINILSHPFTKKVLLQKKRMQTGNAHAQLDAVSSGNILQGHNNGLYEFWSNPSIILSHPNILHYGISEFKYQPKIGIITAKYLFYFLNTTSQSEKLLLDNYFDVVSIDEKASSHR